MERQKNKLSFRADVISEERLNLLSSERYKYYLTLKQRKDSWQTLFWWITFSILLISLSFIIFFLVTRVLGDSKYCVGAILVFFTIGFINTIFEGEFDAPYSKIFNYFFSKTETEAEITELKTHFDLVERQFELIEKQIEEDAILILSKIEVETRKRNRENRNISNDLRFKRKWQPCYEKNLETVKNNCELNSEAYRLAEENVKYLKFDKEKLRHFLKLRDDLSNPFLQYYWLSTKINSFYGKPLISNHRSTNPLTNKKDSSVSPSQNVNENNQSDKKQSVNPIDKNKYSIDNDSSNVQNPTILNKTYNKSNEKPVQTNKQNTEIIRLPKSSIEHDIKQPGFDFESPKVNLRNPDEIPVKKSTPKYQRIIKTSPEFYLKVADKKMDVGKKGELLVMEYEKQRLTDEGESVEKRLRHTSVEDGDGYGYDICSSENGKKIFIEVKTTTGSFWSNLFFTQNEFDVMNKYNEEYYLYRVCNFDTDTNLGELFVFKGKEMITSFFEFQSKVYVLTDKSKSIA